MVDFIFPFFSSLETVLHGQVFDYENKRETHEVLQQVLLQMRHVFLDMLESDMKLYGQMYSVVLSLVFERSTFWICEFSNIMWTYK